MTVILVLGALLVLCTPFMMTARNADLASGQLFDRAQSRLALDSAAIHAKSKLQRSCWAVDETRYWDSLEELTVSNRFSEGFYDANDPNGVMWDLDVTDLAGLIDLNSAPPQLIANMIGASTRFIKPVEKDDDTLPVSSTAGFEPDGYLWVGGELVRYGAIEGNAFIDLERGLGVNLDGEDNVLPGPRPAGDHGVGTLVLDQRAFAPALWRMQQEDADLRSFDSVEQLRELDEYVLDAQGFGRPAQLQLAEFGTVYGGVGAGSRWQRHARLTREATRELTGTIYVDDGRWFNPGSTLQISDGETTETAVVVAVSGGGAITLDRGLRSDYTAYETVVRVMARRPVNVNTASERVLALVFDGLKLRGRNERITGNEARDLAALCVQSRPFEGCEDFLRRLVLPAAGIEALPGDAPTVPDAFAQGGAVISNYDALALYANALNANDAQLDVSSVPLSFMSRDVYALDLRAAVNAPSGAERFTVTREDVQVVAPQTELLHLWAYQEDFDEALRLGRQAAWWATGPQATSRGGSGTTPPSRLWAHLGTYNGEPVFGDIGNPAYGGGSNTTWTGVTGQHVFAARDEAGWAQLMPSTVADWAGTNVHIKHFDHETRDPEGRYLPDETISYPPDHDDVEWTAGTGLLRGITFSGWVKPKALSDAAMMDVGGDSQDADRLSLLYEGGDLVLRLMDAGGDHRNTAGFKEHVECRYTLGQGEGPGMPVDTWTHVFVDIRGARPSDITMLVNGTAHGVRTPGMTHLTSGVGESDTFLPIESAEGFPERGVVRVGEELVEYVLEGNALNCTYNETGADAGFGGRNARVRWLPGESAVPANLAAIDLNHAVNTTVELYGYSLELASDLPAGSATMPSDLGAFRVAQVTSVEGGSTQLGDTIAIAFPSGATFTAYGIEGLASGVTGLNLAPADDETQDVGTAKTMEAFSRDGGYAAIIQWQWDIRGNSNDALRTVAGSRIGGVEVIRYSGWSGNTLQIAARGDGTGLQKVATTDDVAIGGRRAFITDWAGHTAGGNDINLLLDWQTFVVPISVPAQGGAQSFLDPEPIEIELPANPGQGGQGGGPELIFQSVPEFAQITREDQPELTEWVAYDEVTNGHLVRDEGDALWNAYSVLISPGSAAPVDFDPNNPNPGGGPGGGGTGGGTGGGVGGGGGGVGGMKVSNPSAPSSAARARAGAYWQPMLGQPSDLDMPLTRAVREAMLFRGVMGTHSNAHPAGSVVVPVFHVSYDETNPDVGRPGRYDPVFVLGADFQHLGWPLMVHRAHRPSGQFAFHDWIQQDLTQPIAVAQALEVLQGPNAGANVTQNDYYVALTEGCPEPMTAGSIDPTAATTVEDTRAITRLAKFPSGERARDVSSLGVGAGFQQGSGGILSAVVDEVLFAHPEFGMNTPNADGETMQGAPMILAMEFPANGNELQVWPNHIRIPRGRRGSAMDFLSTWKDDAGLIKVGNEILCYESLDAANGVITIAANGWGLLGTDPQPHAVGETVTWLEHWPVSVLTGPIGAEDSVIPITNTDEFPPEGTVRIGDELIHYTRTRGNSLEMPAGSKEPGRRDGLGPGIFRGRYGTPPTGHGAGEVVMLFPHRYWDRWAPRADAPELSYFEFELDRPAAWWQSVFWIAEQPVHGGARFRVLQRTDPDVPWDADPETTEGLDLLDDGLFEDGPIPIGVQSDHVQWRLFVEYMPGAFDPLNASAHGWRTTPRLKQFGAFYVAPEITLRSLER